MKIKWVLAVCLFFLTSKGFATVILPVSLEEIANRADVVFRGVCEDRRRDSVSDPKTRQAIPVFICKFKVLEVVKGGVGSVIEVKQPALFSRRQAVQLGLLGLLDSASLEEGKEYLLFLGPVIPDFGFRWVTGSGGQGKFDVIRDSQGKAMVVNDFGNRNLFKNISPKAYGLGKAEQTVLQAPPGPVPYDDFTSIVRKVLGP